MEQYSRFHIVETHLRLSTDGFTFNQCQRLAGILLGHSHRFTSVLGLSDRLKEAKRNVTFQTTFVFSINNTFLLYSLALRELL